MITYASPFGAIPGIYNSHIGRTIGFHEQLRYSPFTEARALAGVRRCVRDDMLAVPSGSERQRPADINLRNTFTARTKLGHIP